MEQKELPIPGRAGSVSDGSPSVTVAYASGSAWLVLVLYAGSLFLVQLASDRTFTGHECLVAQIAREMLAGGDWLVPRIAGKPWLEKPPLPHWTVAALGGVCGEVSEFVARLPSALAGLLGVLLVASLAARWFGSTRGLLVGLIQATTFYTMTYAGLAEADIYLWLLVLGCLWIFARNLARRNNAPGFKKSETRNSKCETDPNDQNQKSQTGLEQFTSFELRVLNLFRISDFVLRVWLRPKAALRFLRFQGHTERLVFFFLLGLTQLTKGPLFGAVIALLPCVGFMVLQRSWGRLKWLLYWPGWLVFVAVGAAWPLAILLRYPDTAELWWAHTFGRVGGEAVLNPNPPWHYLTTLPWQLLPWTLAVLPALVSSFLRAWRDQSAPDRFLWLWFALPFLALSAVSAKHHHYLIYALPPFSFWAAEGLLCWRELAQRFLAHPARSCALALLGVAGLGGLVGWTRQFQPDYATDALIVAILVLIGSVIVCWACARRQYQSAGIALFALLWVIYGYGHTAVLPQLGRYGKETEFLRRAGAGTPSGEPILIFGLEPSRLLLYLDAPAEVFTSPDELRERGRQLPQARILTSMAHEEVLRKLGKPVRIDQSAATEASPARASCLALYQMEWHAGKGKQRRNR